MARSACAVLLAAIGVACGQTSNGDCTDKGLCDNDASAPDDAAGDGGSTGGDGAALDGARDAPDDVPRSPDGCPLNEICNDGIDDNCDGKVDCADPQCGAFACVEAPPMGWKGPVELSEVTGTPAPTPAMCAGGYSTDAVVGNADPSAPPPTCLGCTCGSPTGVVTCPPIGVTYFSDASCTASCVGGSIGLPAPNPSLFCVGIGPPGACGAQPYVKATSIGTSGGSCMPMPNSGNDVPPLQWGRAARACGLPSVALTAGCTAPAVCAPSPSAPFLGHLCVSHDGDVSCPSMSTYSSRHLYYADKMDTRACSTCTCDAPTGTCLESYSAYGESNCQTVDDTYVSTQACTAILSGVRGIATTNAATPMNVSCQAHGGAAVGAFMATLPTTVCCAQ